MSLSIPTKTSQNSWESSQGNDYLQVKDGRGSVLSWIDSDGRLQGTFAVPPIFNVRAFGAKGDTQRNGPASYTVGNSLITCNTCGFRPEDVGKTIYGAGTVNNVQLPQTTIASYVSPTQVRVTNFTGGVTNSTMSLVWGTIDDVAIKAAVDAFKLQLVAITQDFRKLNTASPILYFPAGGYLVQNHPSGVISIGAGFDWEVRGDGSLATTFYITPSSTFPLNGAIFNNSNAPGKIIGFSVQGSNLSFANTSAFFFNNGMLARDIRVDRWGNGTGDGSNALGININGSGFVGEAIVVIGGNLGMSSSAAANVECRGCGLSNNGNANLTINNFAGPNGGAGFRWIGGVIDECNSATATINVLNSKHVYFIGTTAFGATGAINLPALRIDGTSEVYSIGSTFGPFGSNVTGGVTILAGGVLRAVNSTFLKNGTGASINNAGTFFDDQSNTVGAGYTGAGAVYGLSRQGVAFANLGTPVNFTYASCTDCTIANPCAAGGTGALAKRLNGAWVCN